ncbi:MAG: SDR family NAD(P)-dependent oxidoreductase [Gemmatimonadota bacterium]|nr:MAG: SDR family NAD(P)-dependent oxidoreductase [Gemmatimonadota bacterium]
MVVRFLLSAALRLLVPLVAISYLTLSPVTAQELENQRAVLITGTSTGIGLRMTEVLSQNGFFVYAGARKAEDLERLDAMENVKSVRLDVTIQSELDAAVELVRAEGRGLYGLINNAGVAVIGPLIEQPEEELDFIIDVNLLGPYRVTKAFADLLIESEGRVLTVSSIAGILSTPFVGAYSMTKHGVEAYTDALAAELDRFNVAVAAVEPGNYKSQILASMVKRMREAGYSAEGSRYGSMLDLITGPLDRSQHKEPTDVALAALDFLTSESPKRRYMVAPNQAEAEVTIRQALRELVQLNQDQPYAYTRDELVQMLDEALGDTEPAASRTSPSSEEDRDISLHEAIVRGDLEAVRELIEAGADLNVREPSGGSSPLITAATFGQTEAAKALIEAGADLGQQNNDGSTALITAAFFARADIVEALLAAGADKSIRNNAGSTALDVVTPPFEVVRDFYDLVGAALAPYGLELDYERIEATRPRIAEMLQ